MLTYMRTEYVITSDVRQPCSPVVATQLLDIDHTACRQRYGAGRTKMSGSENQEHAGSMTEHQKSSTDLLL